MNKKDNKIDEKTRALFKRCLLLLLPPENLTVAEWADKYRVLSTESSKEAGKWETSRTPYMLEIYNVVTKEGLRQLTLMMAAQLAKSELIINIFGRYVHLDPCPMLLVQPTDDMASAFSKERLEPAIRESKILTQLIKDFKGSRKGGDTVLHKMFKGGFLAAIGTNAPSKLAARPIRIAFMDEVDRYAKSSGKEGSPIALVKKRLTTFADTSKCIITGTPTIREASPVEEEFKNSSQAEWHLACPHCKTHQALKFSNLKWEEDNPASVKMQCTTCGKMATEKEWKRNNQETGIWIHKYPERTEHLGYHLSALASVFRTWESIVKEFLEIRGDKEKLKAFINTVLAETWEDENVAKLDFEKLYKAREKYSAEVPDDVLILTAGIDTQDDWLAIEVVGWGTNGVYGIEYKTIHGNPKEEQIWRELDLYLQREFKYADGQGLHIYAACIDTGGNHTQRVYDYVAPRQHKRIIGIKGQGGDAVPVNNGFRKTDGRGRNSVIQLLSIGVNALKDITYSGLHIRDKNIKGYCHFPKNHGRGYDMDYFMSLTAEVKSYKNKKVEWIKIRDRNEALDCRNYATVPFYIFNFDMEQLSQLTREQLIQLSKTGTLNLGAKRERVRTRGIENDY